MKYTILSISFMVLAHSLQAQAQIKFADMMMSLSGHKEYVIADTPNHEELFKVDTLEQAEKIARGQNYLEVLQAENKQNSIDLSFISTLAAKKKTTIVIVPGLLGEFIDTRAFEEVFERSSVEKTNWAKMMESNAITDPQYSLRKNSFDNPNLSELIDVASIDDAARNPLLKLVILKTKRDSMESIGSIVERAKIFNRRLQKFTEISGDENLVLLGYSRGTPLALEMITQAEHEKISYLSKVAAVVSYAGVVMGSSLADLTGDPNTASGKQFIAVRKLLASLKTTDFFVDRLWKGTQNLNAIAQFAIALGVTSDFDPKSFLNTAMSGDFKTVAMLILDIIRDLAAMSVTDFNGHVLRLKKFINEILLSVEDLKTKSRVSWFQTHTLPKNIKYYSISAMMVDPAHSTIEKEIFDKKIGYNETLDDEGLQGNRRTYEKATGFALNDSQVAIHQSIFMPKVIENLNPNNTELHFENLGAMHTHHWGLSLRVVNKMNDGRINPFPRENALLALVAYLNQ